MIRSNPLSALLSRYMISDAKYVGSPPLLMTTLSFSSPYFEDRNQRASSASYARSLSFKVFYCPFKIITTVKAALIKPSVESDPHHFKSLFDMLHHYPGSPGLESIEILYTAFFILIYESFPVFSCQFVNGNSNDFFRITIYRILDFYLIAFKIQCRSAFCKFCRLCAVVIYIIFP